MSQNLQSFVTGTAWGLRSVAGVAAGGGMAKQAPEAEIAGHHPAATVSVRA